jgi:aspartate kinase
MPLSRVLKFGGDALRDGRAIERAVELVRTQGGPRPVVVVSAHGGVTAMLAQAAGRAERGELAWEAIRVRHRSLLRELGLDGELLDRHLLELRVVLERLTHERAVGRRQLEFVLSFGERMSARVVAAALRRAGVEAAPIDAFDLGVVRSVGPAPLALARGCGDRVRGRLAGLHAVPVVTGFLALDDDGHLTTLGRNGSDLTAVWLGRELDAERVELWKTVPGVLTADPRLAPDARLLPHLDLDTAAELARCGADVLHPEALEPARGAPLAVRLRDVADPAADGTTIRDGGPAPTGPVALAHRMLSPALEALSLVGGGFDDACAARVAELTRGFDPTSSTRELERGPRSLTVTLASGAVRDALLALHAELLATGASRAQSPA